MEKPPRRLAQRDFCEAMNLIGKSGEKSIGSSLSVFTLLEGCQSARRFMTA